MSKKKRKNRPKEVSQSPGGSPDSQQPSVSHTFSSNRIRAFTIAGVALVISGIVWYTLPILNRSATQDEGTAIASKVKEETPEALLERLSRSTFDGMEKQVVEKIRGLVQ